MLIVLCTYLVVRLVLNWEFMLTRFVDGPFIEEQKEYGLKWRGSKNQIVIDLETGKDLV